MHPFLDFSPQLKVLPVVHGSGDFAVKVREALLREDFDCLAVPLPATFADSVTAAVENLPAVTAVVQLDPETERCTYVPIDPCQPVVAGIRTALQERVAVEFVDLESRTFDPREVTVPDPYSLKTLPLDKYAAAVLPFLPAPDEGSLHERRARRMAFELHRLELDYKRILFLPNLLDWPWIRQAYKERLPYPEHERYFAPIRTYAVAENWLTFFLGELPFITALYERSRATADPDDNLTIDGVKELIVEARDRWHSKLRGGRDWLTPKLLQLYLQYVRNLTLLERRLSPDLYTLVVAAKQIAGDAFALSVLETARDYPIEYVPVAHEPARFGVGQVELPGVGVAAAASRLPGQAFAWRNCELNPEPDRKKSKLWQQITWDPYKQCSWPAEDDRIESFHTHVREQAKALLGADLARSEKFTTSIKDGIDIRETLRHWHTGDLYVKDIPPARGGVDTVVFLFDVPADPERYSWRTTWHAEHKDESTIGLFATDFRQDLVGPGIGRAVYGGVFFLYPPRYIPDVWTDPRFPRAESLEERLLYAAVFHSQERHVVVVSPCPLKASWRRMARDFGKKLVHLPLSRFSGRTVDRLRIVHVLNGKDVRSYAAHFIRDE